MNKDELKAKILEENPTLILSNLHHPLKKEHLESWVNTGEITLSAEILVKIFSERNERAAINEKLNQTNFGLQAKIGALTKNLTDWNKSELIQQFKKLFGSVKKEDDAVLSEIGAVSKESARADISTYAKIFTYNANVGYII
ncbi:MAG: hypothetical protein SAJ12_23650, partial [Jaaginema sp. PMC 1079.18]|nr:hypothetical protein [Jaaginema sp. PMC 1080.18]MEC4853988.1 hypothetical protein [Jaaginema sp. PMC 1079.18]MEC4867060.1 hypothetical protein [Jaaginema sp. PMC 1078.18]